MYVYDLRKVMNCDLGFTKALVVVLQKIEKFAFKAIR